MSDVLLHRCYFLATGPAVCKLKGCPVWVEGQEKFHLALRLCVSQKEAHPDIIENSIPEETPLLQEGSDAQ